MRVCSVLQFTLAYALIVLQLLALLSVDVDVALHVWCRAL
jgi:hypothetical protein